MFLFLFWLACTVASIVIAGNKGRSGCAFFAISCILGPIALVIALVIQPTDEFVTSQAIRRGELRHCPACMEPINASASVCPHCRTASTPE